MSVRKPSRETLLVPSSPSQEATPSSQAAVERKQQWPPITVLICSLNEAPNLAHVLPKIPSQVDEVLLVDGHSTDGTVEVAKRLRPDIHVLYQPGQGKAEALRYGIEQATGEIIVTLDADGETDPEDMPRFIEPLLAGYDFVKGSRFATGWRHKPPHRLLGNFVIANTCNILYGTRFTDLCSGYNAFWKNILDRANIWADDGWNYEPLIIARVLRAGLKVREVAQTFGGRIGEESKLGSWGQGLTSIKVLVRERFSSAYRPTLRDE